MNIEHGTYKTFAKYFQQKNTYIPSKNISKIGEKQNGGRLPFAETVKNQRFKLFI